MARKLPLDFERKLQSLMSEFQVMADVLDPKRNGKNEIARWLDAAHANIRHIVFLNKLQTKGK